jgi:hypothetical protein
MKKHPNLDKLIKDEYELVESWRGWGNWKLYQKENHQVIYDPTTDKVISGYRKKEK